MLHRQFFIPLPASIKSPMSHKWHGESQLYHAPWQQWQLWGRQIRHERGEAHLTEAMRKSGWIQRCAIRSRKRWIHRYQTSAFKVTFIGELVYLLGGYPYQSCFYIDPNWVGSRGNPWPQVGVSGSKGNAGKKTYVCFVLQPLGKVCLDGWEGALPGWDGLFSIEFRAVDMVQIGHMIFKIAVFYWS